MTGKEGLYASRRKRKDFGPQSCPRDRDALPVDYSQPCRWRFT